MTILFFFSILAHSETDGDGKRESDGNIERQRQVDECDESGRLVGGDIGHERGGNETGEPN